MEENKKNEQVPLRGGDMGTSENNENVQNPVNTGSKSEHQPNSGSVAQTRNATDRAAGLGTKRDVTGSDFDGQVSA